MRVGVRSHLNQEPGIWKLESGFRVMSYEGRSQKSGVRNQEPGIWNLEFGTWSQS